MSRDVEPVGDGPAVDRFVERAIMALELPDHRDNVAVRNGLSDVAENWVAGRLMQSISGRPGDQRIRLRQLAQSIRKTTELMSEIAPEYVAAIAVDEEGRPIPFFDAQDTLSRLQDRVEHFDRVYEPQNGSSDFALDEAVRDLLELFRTEGLGQPKVRQGREGIEPRLLSKEAVAIGSLLQGLAPELETRTLVNKISEVAKGQKPVASHLDAIFAACDGDLDASLLPTRKGLTN